MLEVNCMLEIMVSIAHFSYSIRNLTHPENQKNDFFKDFSFRLCISKYPHNFRRIMYMSSYVSNSLRDAQVFDFFLDVAPCLLHFCIKFKYLKYVEIKFCMDYLTCDFALEF